MQPDAAGAYIDAGISQPGYYSPEGSFEPIKCPEGTYTGDEGREGCDYCSAGYFCDGLGITKDLRPLCAKGYYCPSYEFFITERDLAGASVVEYRQMPCPEGTYNPYEAKSVETDCLDCPATFACERTGLWDLASFPLCAAGYYCKSGAKTRYPDGTNPLGDAGPCPAGFYCPEGTENPIPCAIGTFSPQLKATDADFCLPCPPGYLCT